MRVQLYCTLLAFCVLGYVQLTECAFVFAVSKDALRKRFASAMVAPREGKIQQPRDLLNLTEPTRRLNNILKRFESFELWRNKVTINVSKQEAQIEKEVKVWKATAGYRFRFGADSLGIIPISADFFARWRFG